MKLNLQNLKIEDLSLAVDPYTTPETLDSLANDECNMVRCFVAGNRSTSPETLEHLANDADSLVRANVARNPNTFQYIKDYLKICKFIKYYEVGPTERLLVSK
jgi:hypothetical protein